jgi:hypothetical protein
VEFTVVEGGKGARKPLAEIDTDLIAAIEELFAEAPDTRVATPVLGSKEDAEAWLSDARAYAYHRGTIEGKMARLMVAGNAVKDGSARLTVSAYVAPVKDSAE